MKSVDEMNDAELDALLAQPASPKSVDDMSDDELDKLLQSGAKPQPTASAPGFNKVDAFLGQALDTITMGHAPQTVAGMRNLSFSSPSYIQDRDNYRAGLENSDEHLAKAVATGVGAAVPMVVAPQAFLPDAAYGGSKIVQGALNLAKNFGVGEAMTGMQNPGDVKGETTGLQLKERADRILDPTNAAINLGAAAVGTAVKSKADKMIADKNHSAFRTLEPAVKNTENAFEFLEDEITPDRAERIGNLVKNTGILKGSPDVVEIARRSASKLKEIGTNIESIFKSMDSKLEHGAENFPKFKKEKLAEVLNRKYEGDGELAGEVADQVEKIILDRFKFKEGKLKLSDLQTIRQNIQKKVNYKVLFNSDSEQLKNSMFDSAAKYYNKYIDDLIDVNQHIFGDSGKRLKVANQQYHLMSDAVKISNKAAAKITNADTAKNFVQNMLNPAGLFAGAGVGAYSNSPLLGLGTTAAINGVEAVRSSIAPRANSMAANIAASKVLPRVGNNANVSAQLIGGQIAAPNPFEIDRHIKRDPNLKPSEKAKLRNQNMKDAK